MKNIILTLIITLPLTLCGQGWQKLYNSNPYSYSIGKSITYTNDGGFIISGSQNELLWMFKVNENGAEQFSKTFGETKANTEDIGNVIIKDLNNRYVICGTTVIDGTPNSTLIKTDNLGNEEWIKYFNLENNSYSLCESLDITNDNGYVLLNRSKEFLSTQNNIYKIIKTNNDGNIIWTKIISDEDEYAVRLKDIKQTNDNGFIVCGNIINDFLIIKLDSNGNEEWQSTYFNNNNNQDISYSIEQTYDNGYIIAGEAELEENLEGMGILKIDSNGNEEWKNHFITMGI